MMKVKRKRKHYDFTLADETIENIDEYKVDKELKNRSRAIDDKFKKKGGE